MTERHADDVGSGGCRRGAWVVLRRGWPLGHTELTVIRRRRSGTQTGGILASVFASFPSAAPAAGPRSPSSAPLLLDPEARPAARRTGRCDRAAPPSASVPSSEARMTGP